MEILILSRTENLQGKNVFLLVTSIYTYGEWSDTKALEEISPEKELLPWGPFASHDEGTVV